MSAWRRLRATLVAALVVSTPMALAAQEPPKEPTGFDLARVSTDLQVVGDLFGGGGGKPVTFDAASAAARGLSPDSIELAAELAAYTNALMGGASTATGTGATQAQAVDVSKVRVDPQQFPHVAQLFDEATNRSNQLSDDPKQEDAPQMPDGAYAPSFLSEYNCGSFIWPRPGRGAPWRAYAGPYVNPAATLSSWGYHSTPDWAGGGFTRPQTYLPWLCGWSTFRDHAYTVGRAIREQNYAGWAPRGEPNPEIWRVGPWPYLTWPAYVNWWHSRY